MINPYLFKRNLFVSNRASKSKSRSILGYEWTQLIGILLCFRRPLAVPGSNQDKKKASSTDAPATTPAPITPEDEEEQRLGIKSTLARNIFRTLFRPPPRRINELFLPHRMAYIIDLEATNGQQDEENDRGSHTMDDIPTTLIRSKADCPNAEVCLSIFASGTLSLKRDRFRRRRRWATTISWSINSRKSFRICVIRNVTWNVKRRKVLASSLDSSRKWTSNQRMSPSIPSPVKPRISGSASPSLSSRLDRSLSSMYDDIGDYIPDIKRRSNTSSNPKEKSQPDTSNRKRVYFNSETKFVSMSLVGFTRWSFWS